MLFFQGLVGARKKEIETESHLLTIAEREEGRLKQEINKLEKEIEELKERKNVFEVINVKLVQNCEVLILEMFIKVVCWISTEKGNRYMHGKDIQLKKHVFTHKANEKSYLVRPVL